MRYFSYDEAQAAVPGLIRIFDAAHEIRGRAEEKANVLHDLEKRGDPDPARAAMERAQLEFLAKSLEEALRGVESMGAVLKGLEPGLVDFPYKLEGREVYLCWTYGETSIGHYHGLEEGFSGRQPLPKRLLPQ